MEQLWRWFGPSDPVSLRDAKHAGAEGIVSALHDLKPGQAWPLDQIRRHQELIAASGLRWSVVESLEVSEDIKSRGPRRRQHINAFVQSLRNLSACGIRTVAYNFMPIFSWTRTDLRSPRSDGSTTLRFDATAFAAFDLFLLRRDDAEADWSEARCSAAYALFKQLSQHQRETLEATILNGLPGGHRALQLDQLRILLATYNGIGFPDLRAILSEFLRAVCPVAAHLGVKLCIHPDDPPRPLLGLPRVVSTGPDLDFLIEQTPEESNAITFCTGSLGVRADNPLTALARRFAPRIGFAHLRSVRRDRESLEDSGSLNPIESFVESDHLEGDADLVSVIAVLVEEERRRVRSGLSQPIPFRADHGQRLQKDLNEEVHPGYPAIGRLRGLAELRGVLRATEHHQKSDIGAL